MTPGIYLQILRFYKRKKHNADSSDLTDITYVDKKREKKIFCIF
jgi:hypothetical protein